MSWLDLPPLEDFCSVCWLLVVALLLLDDGDAGFLVLLEALALEAEVSSSSDLSFLGAEAPYSSDASFRGAAAPPLAFIPGSAIECQLAKRRCN